jgi:hypothetical protein
MGAPKGNCNACKSRVGRYRSVIKRGKTSLYKRLENKRIGYRQWKTKVRTQREWGMPRMGHGY